MLLSEMTKEQIDNAIKQAKVNGYSVTYSYDGDLVAFVPSDGWADYDMYQTYDLTSYDGYVIAYKQ